MNLKTATKKSRSIPAFFIFDFFLTYRLSSPKRKEVTKKMKNDNLLKRLWLVVSNKNDRSGVALKEVDGTDLIVKLAVKEDGKIRQIKDSEMKELRMTRGELFKEALDNLRSDGYDLRPLSEVLDTYDPTGILYLSKSGGEGSSLILDKNVLQQASERIGSYFILPVSVDELLLVPKSSGFTAKDLSYELDEINRLIPAEKRLSNQVYEYSFSKRKITKPMLEKEEVEQAQVSLEQETVSTHMGRI